MITWTECKAIRTWIGTTDITITEAHGVYFLISSKLGIDRYIPGNSMEEARVLACRVLAAETDSNILENREINQAFKEELSRVLKEVSLDDEYHFREVPGINNALELTKVNREVLPRTLPPGEITSNKV